MAAGRRIPDDSGVQPNEKILKLNLELKTEYKLP